MSNRYFPENRRRRVAAPIGSSSPGRRTVLGYWVPLLVTVGVATAGLAAWIWSERRDDEGETTDEEDGEDHKQGPDGEPIRLGPSSDYPQSSQGYERDASSAAYGEEHDADAGVISRVQGALRRTPSPQQLFDGASRKVAAGVAAAGAVVGSALTAIREESSGDFEDHSRWNEEANSKERTGALIGATNPPTMSGAITAPAPVQLVGKGRKTVAIVLSSVAGSGGPSDTEADFYDHASVLSHLPEYVTHETARVFVLIHAPGLKLRKSTTTLEGAPSRPPLSMESSYSNIGLDEATAVTAPIKADDLPVIEPHPVSERYDSASAFFRMLYNQAEKVVDDETMIMPFTTPNGHIHILRHLSPDIVYIQESLTGDNGEAVHQISAWVTQVVVIIGDEGGRGGLVDSDDDSALADTGEKWWQKEGVTGLGKRINVVDGLRAGEDWRRRVSGVD